MGKAKIKIHSYKRSSGDTLKSSRDTGRNPEGMKYNM
jgi:hypothetical protein